MAKKKKKKVESSGPKGAPDWVVTFTDMISLLVTFFVLLLTFSSTEDFDRLQVRGFITGTRGALKSVGGHVARETLDDDLVSATDIRRGGDQSHSRPAKELGENLEEMGQSKTDDHKEYDFSGMKDGLQIVFGPDCSFEPGSAEPNAALEKSLGELGRIMEHYPHLVLVEGFTDNNFRATTEYPDAETLALSRSLAASEVLLGTSNLNPNLLQVAGLGVLRPRASNESADGRKENRRVEVRVLALSKSRSDHYDAASAEERRDF